jgi:glyoxylase-like metal-dependent hydrolase (beta-lactamase superfamily II)
MDVETFVVPPLDNNVYLVYDGETREAVLIDPALGAAKVLPRISDRKLALKFVVNTHGHADHVADNAPIAKELGAKIGIHEADAYRLEQVSRERRDYLPKPPPPSKADVVLKEASVVKVGAVELRVLHTPGHTEGSVSFYLPSAGYLFTGDTLLRGTFGTTGGAGASPAFLLRSLRRLWELPPDTKVFPGHGPLTTLADETWIPNLRYAAPH